MHNHMKNGLLILCLVCGIGISGFCQKPTGKWYLERYELNDNAADPMSALGMQLLYKREIGNSYIEFSDTDAIKVYMLLRGEMASNVQWASPNSYFSLREDAVQDTIWTFIQWLGADEILLTNSVNNSEAYYRKEFRASQ